MAQLYADEDYHYGVVEELRRLGHDVLTAFEAGNANIQLADQSQLTFACCKGRAILTFNRWHFIRLHRIAQPHRGIIICTRDNDVVALAARIHQALLTLTTLDNQLIRVNRPSTP